MFQKLSQYAVFIRYIKEITINIIAHTFKIFEYHIYKVVRLFKTAYPEVLK